MNKVLLIIILSFFAVSSTQASINWPWLKRESNQKTNNVSTVVVTKSKNPIQDSKLLVKELSNELKEAKTENNKLKNSLFNANEKIKTTEVKVAEVQKAADSLREWGIVQQAEAFKWMEKFQKTLKRYHRLKTIASVIAGIAGCLIGMWCMRFVPPTYAPYAFLLPVAGFMSAAAGVWFFL